VIDRQLSGHRRATVFGRKASICALQAVRGWGPPAEGALWSTEVGVLSRKTAS
jgi:hypothetical protein